MAERSFAITLPAVAERADVTVKTVLRHFGSRDALIDAAWAQAYDDVMAETHHRPTIRWRHWMCSSPTTSGFLGEIVLAMLSQENDPRAQRMNNAGRLGHRAWVEEVFGDRLPERSAARGRLVDVLVVATDVYSWKLLRLDRGLSVADVHDRMLLMTEAVLAGTPAYSAVVRPDVS